ALIELQVSIVVKSEADVRRGRDVAAAGVVRDLPQAVFEIEDETVAGKRIAARAVRLVELIHRRVVGADERVDGVCYGAAVLADGNVRRSRGQNVCRKAGGER